jgi:hypothetical protein
MTEPTMPTQAEFDCALWLNGEAAIEVAEAAAGAPGWPPREIERPEVEQ